MRTKRDKREFTERNQRMWAMHEMRKTLKEIAEEFHISAVRVHQILVREKQRINLKQSA